MIYFLPPGALSITDAVNRLAGRKYDDWATYWTLQHEAWQELREAIQTGKLTAYILDHNSQSHEADPA